MLSEKAKQNQSLGGKIGADLTNDGFISHDTKPITEKAKQNQSIAGKQFGRGKEDVNSLGKSCPNLSDKGRVRDIIGERANVSGRTVDKVKKILQKADLAKQRQLAGVKIETLSSNGLKVEKGQARDLAAKKAE